MYRLIYSYHIILSKYFKSDSITIRLYKRLAEKILIIYFLLNPFKPRLVSNNEAPDLIVSLTTFPPRVGKVWMAIESILYQSKKPDKVIIWLAKDEFESKRTLPIRLLRLQKRGLEIRFVQDNLMPHKKYFYTIQKYPVARVITVDDDFIYPPKLIDSLINKNLDYPNAIICPITRRISIENNKVSNYKNWKRVVKNCLPDAELLTMGGGGALFPANCLSKKAFDSDKIKSTALKSDDLWIKVMAILNDTKVVSLAGDFSYSYLPIFHSNNNRLMDENIEGGNNDFVFQVLLVEYNIQLDEILNKRRGE